MPSPSRFRKIDAEGLIYNQSETIILEILCVRCFW